MSRERASGCAAGRTVGIAAARAVGSGSRTISLCYAALVSTGAEGLPGEDCGRAIHAVNNPSAQSWNGEIPLVPLGISCHSGSTLWNNSTLVKTKQKKMPKPSLLSSKAGETWKLSEFLGNVPRYNQNRNPSRYPTVNSTDTRRARTANKAATTHSRPILLSHRDQNLLPL